MDALTVLLVIICVALVGALALCVVTLSSFAQHMTEVDRRVRLLEANAPRLRVVGRAAQEEDHEWPG
jgi:hypothetical protein